MFSKMKYSHVFYLFSILWVYRGVSPVSGLSVSQTLTLFCVWVSNLADTDVAIVFLGTHWLENIMCISNHRDPWAVTSSKINGGFLAKVKSGHITYNEYIKAYKSITALRKVNWTQLYQLLWLSLMWNVVNVCTSSHGKDIHTHFSFLTELV